jgi:hypothetical protein
LFLVTLITHTKPALVSSPEQTTRTPPYFFFSTTSLESRNSRDHGYCIGAMANIAGEKKTVTVDVERFVHTRNAVSFTQTTTNPSTTSTTKARR